MATSSSTISRNPNLIPSFKRHTPSTLSFHTTLKLPITCSTKFLNHPLKTTTTKPHAPSLFTTRATTGTSYAESTEPTIFHGLCYVVGDNIDTDQIIPAEHLTLVPSNPDEYKKLGSYALSGLPYSYDTYFVHPGKFRSQYSIVIGGENFGCGSSREHAPVALGAAGVKAVVAASYARIFFRNSVATGEVYPLESEVRLCEECKTGDVVTIRLPENLMMNHITGKVYHLKSIGDAGPVIKAGGIFNYARETGMIPSPASS